MLVALLKVPAPDDGEIDQVTPAAPGSLATVAVSTSVSPAATRLELPVTDTTIAGTVTVADAEIDALATDVAVMVTFISLEGGLAGAV